MVGIDEIGKVGLVAGVSCSLIAHGVGFTAETLSDLSSPQLDSKAINHLCNSLSASVIYADARLYETTRTLGGEIIAINLSNVLAGPECEISKKSFPNDIEANDVAFLFHTSGTSSGLPKSIPQTHHAAVGVLPCLPADGNPATFSTTPLYHGGIADCLRAWSSGATIHLFPGTQPITTTNILRAIEQANTYAQGACTVKYFTSVPYILQMLATESEGSQGLSALQRMDLVGVGGAALPTALGDELVSKNVNLVSRYGSAECGFLLSSHREYKDDQAWSWLRADPSLQPRFYDFEAQTHNDAGDGPELYEFIVKPEWPHRGKTNRDDGSFATADLFERHPDIPHAWRYHSRADAQITLVNGKKFDPSPIEGELLASAAGQRLLKDVMIFGTGRDVPGLLLFARGDVDVIDEAHLIGEIWPTLEKMNRHTQNHARISRANVVVVKREPSAAATLPKSSKGTILRKQAESSFHDEIERAYGDADNEDASSERKLDHVPDDQVVAVLSKLFDDVLGRHIDPSEDLFTQGVDSIACLQLKKRISKILLDPSGSTLPLNVIYDQGSINQLSEYILKRRKSDGASAEIDDDESNEHQCMLDLVSKYKHGVKKPTKTHDPDKKQTVVLTGATGLLGAHLLDVLLQDASIEKVFCLVRAKDVTDATNRVAESIKSRGLAPPSIAHGKKASLECLPAALSDKMLGLAEADWKRIAEETSLIIHSAWPVNFALKLKSFESQLAGLRNLQQLRDATVGSSAQFVFISSIAAVSAAEPDGRTVPETPSSNPADASPLGYSRSKWVAERMCTTDHVDERQSESSNASESASEGSPFTIVRVGQLCGNSQGVWNRTEAYPLMLSSAKITGCIPQLDEPLSWLPADQAAHAIIEIALSRSKITTSGTDGPIFHVLNHHQKPTWTQTMSQIIKQGASASAKPRGKEPWTDVKIVPASEWLQRLEKALETKDHPARSLLSLWQSAYAKPQETSPLIFENKSAQAVSASLHGVQPLNGNVVMRMWKWIDEKEE
jgi:thioester reductase-like protein